MRVVCPPEPTTFEELRRLAPIAADAGKLAIIFAALLFAWFATP